MKVNDDIIDKLINYADDNEYLWVGEFLEKGGLNFFTVHEITKDKWIRIDVCKSYEDGVYVTRLILRYFDGTSYHLSRNLLARLYPKIYDLFDLCKEKAK